MPTPIGDRLDIYTGEPTIYIDLTPPRCPKCGLADAIQVRITNDVLVGDSLVCRSCKTLADRRKTTVADGARRQPPVELPGFAGGGAG